VSLLFYSYHTFFSINLCLVCVTCIAIEGLVRYRENSSKLTELMGIYFDGKFFPLVWAYVLRACVVSFRACVARACVASFSLLEWVTISGSFRIRAFIVLFISLKKRNIAFVCALIYTLFYTAKLCLVFLIWAMGKITDPYHYRYKAWRCLILRCKIVACAGKQKRVF
jgi:hypothetical protein